MIVHFHKVEYGNVESEKDMEIIIKIQKILVNNCAAQFNENVPLKWNQVVSF